MDNDKDLFDNTIINISSCDKDIRCPSIEKMRAISLPASDEFSSFVDYTCARFYHQAKYMEKFEDHYDAYIDFSCYNGTYDDMSHEQLRCYFTWRTQVRNGNVTKASISYVYTYIYELINNIGTCSPLDTVEKMVFVWFKYRVFTNQLDSHMIRWIKDYYICNDFAVSFKELVFKMSLENYYPDICNGGESVNKLFYHKLFAISDYNISKSTFAIKNHCIFTVKGCFKTAIYNLKPLFLLNGRQIEDLLTNKPYFSGWWQPFPGAIYYPPRIESKQTVISSSEIYKYEQNRWTYLASDEEDYFSTLFVGYIVKRLEIYLKNQTFPGTSKIVLTKDKIIRKIQSQYGFNSNPFHIDLCTILLDDDFDQIIDISAECYCGQKSSSSHKKITDPLAEDEPVPTIALSSQLSEKIGTEPYISFIKMRSIKNDNNTHLGIACQFYQQARILEHLTDTQSQNVDYTYVPPLYIYMKNNQLRCYLTWRTEARKGNIKKTSIAYVYLYAFELIHNIGTSSTEEAIKRLSELLLTYEKTNETLARLLSSWIKDYYICNSFDCSFSGLALKYHIEKFYPNIFIDDKNVEDIIFIYNNISNYKITKSKFFTDKTSSIINQCFKHVLQHIKKYFSKFGIDFEKAVVGTPISLMAWQPFKGSIYYQYKSIPEQIITLCGNEKYQYINNQWKCLSTINSYPADSSHVLGYILKRMESQIREITKYKYKLSPDIDIFMQTMPHGTFRHSAVFNTDERYNFVNVIDTAVQSFFMG